MPRVFSNGPLKDFVYNPFAKLTSAASQISIATPFVTRADELIGAAKAGKRVDIIVGLNAATSPAAVGDLLPEPNIRVRYYAHRRFHAKIYLFDTAAMIGSSNLTDGGLLVNREATITLSDSDDADTIAELRQIFAELWNHAAILTDDVLARFNDAHRRYPAVSDRDELIFGFVGKAEPPNVNVLSRTRTAEQLFLSSLRSQVYDYRAAFDAVKTVLAKYGLQRAELTGLGTAAQASRFLSWVRRTHVPGDLWQSIQTKSEADRQSEIVRLGSEWVLPATDPVGGDYVGLLESVRKTFFSSESVDAATKDELTDGIRSLHAFREQFRFIMGGAAELAPTFWTENNNDTERVRKTLKFLVHGHGDFLERLHDVLFGPMKIRLFGMACAMELYGSVKPDEYPPINGRTVKSLRYLGFNVHVI